jgi:hypothetical protein
MWYKFGIKYIRNLSVFNFKHEFKKNPRIARSLLIQLQGIGIEKQH